MNSCFFVLNPGFKTVLRELSFLLLLFPGKNITTNLDDLFLSGKELPYQGSRRRLCQSPLHTVKHREEDSLQISVDKITQFSAIEKIVYHRVKFGP
jgi:hypothetical protein